MTAQEYIKSRLENLKTTIPGEVVDSGKPEENIRARLMSKKFRKLKATPACEAAVDHVISRAVRDQQPITVSLLFGGNKLWRFEEAPQIDWAELFSLFYYVDWLKRVAAVHKPGVVLDYYSQDVSVESLNNIPRSETDQYSRTFRAMLDWVRPYLPDNVKVTYRRHLEDFDDPDDYYRELELGKQTVLSENRGQLPQLTDAMRAATELNVRLKPGQDADPYWREKVELEHQAIFRTETLGRYLRNKDIITISPTDYEGSNSIITGSTKRSIAKFWAGVGALERAGDDFSEVVLSPKQLQHADFAWEDVRLDGLEGKNFTKIRVLN